MVHAGLRCSKCSGLLPFQPRVNVDLDLDDSSEYSPLSMREMIPLCNEDLDDYDAEITRLQSQIIHIQAQRKRLIHHKKRIHFLLSSFRRFPNEVLCLIFESTCTENLIQEYPWPYNARKPTILDLPFILYLPALAISAVCTRWRSLALASPSLWAQISLEISVKEPPDDDYYVEPSTLDDGFMRTIQLYLDRSLDTPLSISVETRDCGYKTPPALKLLLDHTYRWRHFTYTGIYELDQLLGFDHSFPILETVTLNPGEEGHPWRGEVACFENAPNLHSITTGGQISDLTPSWEPLSYSQSVDVSELSLAWNRLTSLDIRLPKVDERLPNGKDIELLRRHSALTVLKVRSKRTTFEPGNTLLAKVESFTLMKSYTFNLDGTSLLLENFFSSFTLPSLKELIILSETNPSGLIWPPNASSAFLSRSTCMLTTLSLSDIEITDLGLIAALRLLPSLVDFVIDDLTDGSPMRSPITAHFISSMHGSSTPPLLPKLHSLSMGIHVTAFDDAMFVDMVSSRWLPISSSQAAAIGIDCLRSVVLDFSRRRVDAEVYKPLWQLDEMGMCVVITGR